MRNVALHLDDFNEYTYTHQLASCDGRKLEAVIDFNNNEITYCIGMQGDEKPELCLDLKTAIDKYNELL